MPRRNLLLLVAVSVISLVCYHKAQRVQDSRYGRILAEYEQEFRRRMGNQRMLGMEYYSGGHLTHGYRYNISSQLLDAYTYAVNRETGLLDYDEIERLAIEIRPLILLAGYSAYPRHIDFARMREIADKVDAVFVVDMAHFGGLVAGYPPTSCRSP